MNNQILSIYKKEYKISLEKQLQRYSNEMSAMLSTDKKVSFKILGRYKKTKIVQRKINKKKIKSSVTYKRLQSSYNDFELKINNIDTYDTYNFKNQYTADFEKYKTIYIKQLEEVCREYKAWLKNKNRNKTNAIENQVNSLILDRIKSDILEYEQKINNIELKINNINHEDQTNDIINLIISSYNSKIKSDSAINEKNTTIINKIRSNKSGIDNFYKRERSIKYTNKRNKRNLDREQRKFFDISYKFPGYLEKKLNKMPNNKGYIYKGIHFYGKLPSENQGLCMFEKKFSRTRENILHIHEWKNNKYTLYEKIGRDRKKKIKEKILKPVFSQNNLLDFKVKQVKQSKNPKKKTVKINDEDFDEVTTDELNFILDCEYDNEDFDSNDNEDFDSNDNE